MAKPVDRIKFLLFHNDFSYNRGKAIVEKLRYYSPTTQFENNQIQAAIGSKILLVQTIKSIA